MLKIDENISTKNCQSVIDVFSDLTSESRVLLASIKACYIRISLVGTSRVIPFDVLWKLFMGHQRISIRTTLKAPRGLIPLEHAFIDANWTLISLVKSLKISIIDRRFFE